MGGVSLGGWQEGERAVRGVGVRGHGAVMGPGLLGEPARAPGLMGGDAGWRRPRGWREGQRRPRGVTGHRAATDLGGDRTAGCWNPLP